MTTTSSACGVCFRILLFFSSDYITPFQGICFSESEFPFRFNSAATIAPLCFGLPVKQAIYSTVASAKSFDRQAVTEDRVNFDLGSILR
jgi:hypothetical protein